MREASNWNRTVLGRVESEIKRKLAHLQEIRNTITTPDDLRRERCLREDLEELLNREEQMWA